MEIGKLNIHVLREHMNDEQIKDLFSELSAEELMELNYNWSFWARPSQIEPSGNWFGWLVMAGRGFGKDIRNSLKVLTTLGWKLFGDLKIGDIIFDEKGDPTTVTGVFPQGLKQIYRVKFSDRTYTDVGKEHLWTTFTHSARKAFNRSQYETSAVPDDWPTWRPKKTVGHQLGRDIISKALDLHGKGESLRSIERELGCSRASLSKHIKAGKYVEKTIKVDQDGPGPRTITTEEMLNTFTYNKRGDRNHSIPLCKPLVMSEKKLLVEPHLFGLWLGDGSKGTGSLSCHRDTAYHYRYAATNADYKVGMDKPDPKSNGWSMYVKGLMIDLRCMKALDKSIPEEYLHGSIEQRLALLQGLMDSDGFADTSSVEFCAMRKSHADAVMHLARSLGQKPILYTGKAMLDGKDYGTKYRVMWTPCGDVNPFRLKSKADIVTFGGKQQSRNHHRMVVGVEVLDEYDETTCISVDSPNSLFLVGEQLVPTHNTRIGSEWIIERARQGLGPIALIGENAKEVRDTMIEVGPSSIMQVCNPNFMPEYEPSKSRLTFPNGVVCTTFSGEKPKGLRGPQHQTVWADEPAKWPYAEDMVTQMMFGLRIGDKPQFIATTTPIPRKVIKEW